MQQFERTGRVLRTLLNKYVTYGCSAPKLAKVLGLPESEGERLMEAFWEANWPTARLKENVEKFWNTTGCKKWLPAVDGRRLFTRKKSALLNTLFQSCGAIVMDYAILIMDEWLGGLKWSVDEFLILKPHYTYKGCYVGRIGYYHDELEYECEELVAKEVAEMIEKAIVKAGEHLGLKIPLAGEGKCGTDWAAVH